MSTQLTPFVEGFLRGCREKDLTPEQTVEAVKRACALDETIAEEFKKVGGLFLPALGLATTAASLLPYFYPYPSAKPEQKPEQAVTQSSTSQGDNLTQYLQAHPRVTGGHTPNFYAPPGGGALGPQTMPSTFLPPGGLPHKPGYGPTGFPGVPFGAQPGNLPLPGMKSASAQPAYEVLRRHALEKQAFVGGLVRGGSALLGKGIQWLGNATGWQGASRLGGRMQLAQKQYQHVLPMHQQMIQTETQKLLGQGYTRAQAQDMANQTYKGLAEQATTRGNLQQLAQTRRSELSNTLRNAGHGNAAVPQAQVYKNWQEGTPKSFLHNHGGTLLTAGMLGTMLMPMGGGGPTPEQYPNTGMERQASYQKRAAILAPAGALIGGIQGAQHDSALEGAARGYAKGFGTELGITAGGAGGVLLGHSLAKRTLPNIPQPAGTVRPPMHPRVALGVLLGMGAGAGLGGVVGYRGTSNLIGKPSWEKKQQKEASNPFVQGRAS